jgi:hypothetical protein
MLIMLPRHNRFWLIGVVGLWLLAQACAKKEPPGPQTAAVTKANPKIVVAEKKFIFGTVKQGQPVEHVFEIENQGKADLVLGDAIGSCGCLATVLSAKRISPGGKGQVKATFFTDGQRGKQTKQILINSNDPANGRLALGVEGEVIVEISVTPPYFWLKQLKLGEKASREFSLTVNEPQRVRVTAVTVTDKRFTVHRKSGDPKGSAQYELRFLGGRKLERVTAQLLVTAEGSGASTIRAPIQGEVVGNLDYPKVVRVTRNPDESATAEVTFKSRFNQPFKLKRAEDPNKLFKLEILESNGPSAGTRPSNRC